MKKLFIIMKHFSSVKKVNALFLQVVITLAISIQSLQASSEEFLDESSSEKAVFDPAFLMQAAGNEIDVSRFEYRTQLEPGEYRADSYLNEKFIGRESVSIVIIKGKAKILISKALFNKIGLKSTAINSKALAALSPSDRYYDIGALTTLAKVHFDDSDMRLDILIPQAYLQQKVRGYVDSAMWDYGVNGLLLGYNTNYYESVTNSKESQSFYGGTNIGYNLSGWMFRHTGSLTWQKNDRRDYNSLRNYVERDITPLKARLTVGDAYTSGEFFDTFGFRGVAINTVDKMLPDSQRGYAPVVRGVAQSNAHVIIEQNGALLYDTTVPPGPFVINDLYPTGYGGDLNVKVTEADGRVTTFSIPYASVAQLLRPGATYYSAAAGTLRDLNLSYTPKVAQLTLQHGLTNSVTGYGGFLGTGDYSAGLIGAAFGTQFGALAFDVTHARVSAKDNASEGSSYRATFSKMFSETGSSVSIAAYRFSSSGYMDMKNAVLFNDHYRNKNNNDIDFRLQRPRNRLSLTASQSFSEGLGQLYISGFSQNYWNQTGSDNQYQIGYSNNFSRLSYSISANRLRNIVGEQENQFLITFTVPLGSVVHSPSLNMNLGHTSEGFNSQASINGMLGHDDQFNYNVAVARDGRNNNNENISGVYRAPYTSLQGSYGQGDNYRSFSTGATGSVVALSDSITASPYNSETLAVITAPHAEGARVEGYSGVSINNSGNAIVPYLNSYRLNEVSLDPKGLPMDVELQSTRQQVIPHSGAIVRLKYHTSIGRPVLINITNNGKELPLGSVVRDEKGNAVGTVAQGGVIYARLPVENSHLNIVWGEKKQDRCTFNVSIPENMKADNQREVDFLKIKTQCL